MPMPRQCAEAVVPAELADLIRGRWGLAMVGIGHDYGLMRIRPGL